MSIDPERATISAAEQLGPEGAGFTVYSALLDPRQLKEDLSQLDITWTPQYNQYSNIRGIEVTQAFDGFAHKLSQGDQSRLAKMAGMRALNTLIATEIVAPLSEYFPTLTDWHADELSAQRYPAENGRLTWHRDLARHPGVVVIANVYGEATVSVRHHDKEEPVDLIPGDILVLRAPGLFDKNLIAEDIRPEHAVTKVNSPDDRLSVTVRANTQPTKPIQNFIYYNWL